jgi:hypothetical protein
MTGSVTRSDRITRLIVEHSNLSIRPRGLEGFSPLASKAGWQIDQSIEAPTCLTVRLTKA